MLIQSGRVSSLISCPWVALELTSESRTDEVVLHLVRWLVSNLESQSVPFQLLYPVDRRIASQPSLLSPYLWLRVPSLSLVTHITSIMGLQGMVTDSDSNPILVAHDPFMSDLISKVRAASDSWSDGITIGSGVRVLLGSGHNLCGIVEAMYPDGEATIRIALRSRAIRLRIPVRALQHLSGAPSDYFIKEEL